MKKQKFTTKQSNVLKAKFAKHQISKSKQKTIKGGNAPQIVMSEFIVEDEGDM